MTDYTATDRTRVRRLPDRGHYDAETVHAVIDASLTCHLGIVQDGRPFVVPMLHARRDNVVYVHGATSSRMLRHIEAGHDVCVTVTLVDGLVLAKTVFNQSVNYRSAMLFGTGRLVDDPDEKLQALERFTERVMPGQWAHARHPSAQELKATSIVAITIHEASAKVRSGPPKDEGEDRELPIWAGVIPMRPAFMPPVTADYSGADLPPHVQAFLAAREP